MGHYGARAIDGRSLQLVLLPRKVVIQRSA